MLADLHAPLLPILRQVLTQAPLPRAGAVLDLACGEGEKLPLLAAALGPDVRVVGLDRDRAALDAAPRRWRGGEAGGRRGSPQPSLPSAVPAAAAWFIAGDAHALPLLAGRFAAVVCIASLGLFERPALALREARRALQPGGALLVVTAEQRWAEIVRWPDALVEKLLPALDGAVSHPDAGAELVERLAAAGFAGVRVWAYLLEEGVPPGHAELAALPWTALRARAAPQLTAAELRHCDALAASAEVELVTLAVAAHALRR